MRRSTFTCRGAWASAAAFRSIICILTATLSAPRRTSRIMATERAERPLRSLERLSKPMLEGLEADEAAAEGEEGLMDISPPFVADREAPEAIEPGERALDDPAVATQAVAGVDAFTRNADLDVATAQGGSAPRIVIALIRMEFDRPLASLSGGRLGRGDGIQQQLEDLRVVAIGSSQERGKREAAPLDHNMALRARFAPIRWIRADGVAPLLAGMLALSREARLQSMRSVSPRRSRS